MFFAQCKGIFYLLSKKEGRARSEPVEFSRDLLFRFFSHRHSAGWYDLCITM